MSLAPRLRYYVGIHLPAGIRERRGIVDWEALPSLQYAKQLMLQYQTKDLCGADAESFRSKLNEFLALRDFRMEGYTDPGVQRDLSVQFHWGHDHDFGDFFLPGRMGTSTSLTLPRLLIFSMLCLSTSTASGSWTLDVGPAVRVSFCPRWAPK
jgi:hypothetical protein